jgi:hypothetical protein
MMMSLKIYLLRLFATLGSESESSGIQFFVEDETSSA